MRPHFAFKFANSSTALKDIHEVRFQAQHSQAGARQGKPIHAFFTQGMQIVGVPPELIHVVGVQAIASLNGGVNFGDVGKSVDCGSDKNKTSRLITSVHMETPDAIYLLRIENQVYMAMPQ
jgi:hypothetical protein